MRFPDPWWIKALPNIEQPAARAAFMVHVAALYATPDCSIGALADKIGMNRRRLFTCSRPNSGPPIQAAEAILLERACGRDYVSRESILPEIFEIQTE